MTAIPTVACALLLMTLGGCVLYVYEPKLRVESEVAGWWSGQEMQSEADAAYDGRLAYVLVSVRADDPFTPVRTRVRPGREAKVTIQRAGHEGAPAGAWRLGDRNERYFKSRVPRVFAFGDALDVPAGTVLLLEFDPRSLVAGDSPTTGDLIACELRIESGADSETVPVALRVADVDRSWAIGPPTR